jgi:anaerobic magnesium-protoporphyrin IX monomethyl ester cyclase
MKIALVCTDNEELSLGMRIVSAAVKAADYKARLIFMETGDKAFSKKILDEMSALIFDCEVVGFSCLAQGSHKAKQALEFINQLQKKTIWGGVHASLNPDDCADWADYVCIGEGEGMIVEFMKRVSQSSDCKDIENIAYKHEGKLVKNILRPLISNLDELPMPDFSFEDEFHLTKDGFKQVFSLFNVDRNGQIAFTSSRGCAFHCTYCCNIKLKNLYSGNRHYVRRMSVSRLIEHSQQLRKIFPNGRYFYFIDEDFAARPISELAEMAERFPKEVGLPFECLAHPSQITKQKLNLLTKAGLFRIRIGVETGSERTKNEVYNRRVSNETVIQAADILSKYPHVAAVYFFMFANPYESRDDLIATLEFIKLLPYGIKIQAFELIFFPGSALYDQAIADGFIQGDVDSGFELNYYGGLHHNEYPWKKRNLYLNGLIFLAGSSCNRHRIGMIPRFLYKYLIRDEVVKFNERHTKMIETFISLKGLLWKVRYRIGQLMKRVIKDPLVIYNPQYYLRKKVFSKQRLT